MKYSFEDIDKIGLIYEMVGKSDRISDKDRHRITNVVTKYGLDGNGRFETVGEALRALTDALDEMGFVLDMVSDHSIAQAHHQPGSKGRNMLSFRRKNLSGDPYTEEPTIENSRISFNWEDVNKDGKFEVVAYAS
jgi:hypothetical protein